MADGTGKSECVVRVRGSLSDYTERGIMETCRGYSKEIVLDFAEKLEETCRIIRQWNSL
jgi:hypothetical protein